MTCTCGNCPTCNKDWLDRVGIDPRTVGPEIQCVEHPTLRDQIAIAVLNGIVVKNGICDETFAAKSAYVFADAMMKARLLK